jgi:hypothetical protein
MAFLLLNMPFSSLTCGRVLCVEEPQANMSMTYATILTDVSKLDIVILSSRPESAGPSVHAFSKPLPTGLMLTRTGSHYRCQRFDTELPT